MFTLDREHLQDLMSEFYIPNKPKVIVSLEEVQNQHGPHYAPHALLNDKQLSELVLDYINADEFNFKLHFSSIKMALDALGYINIFALVYTIALKKALSSQQSPISDAACLWEDTIETAAICNSISDYLMINVSPTDAFLLGLFYKCGTIPMYNKHDNYMEVIELSDRANTLELSDIEQQVYGVNHYELGYILAKKWGVPNLICDVIANYSSTSLASEQESFKHMQLIALLSLTRNTLSLRNKNKTLDKWDIIKEKVLSTLHINESVANTLAYRKLSIFKTLEANSQPQAINN